MTFHRRLQWARALVVIVCATQAHAVEQEEWLTHSHTGTAAGEMGMEIGSNGEIAPTVSASGKTHRHHHHAASHVNALEVASLVRKEEEAHQQHKQLEHRQQHEHHEGSARSRDTKGIAPVQAPRPVVKGEVGEQGEDGPDGPQGAVGVAGSMGDKGPEGDEGAHGVMGKTGKKGVTGDTGEIGPVGAPAEVAGFATLQMLYGAAGLCLVLSGVLWILTSSFEKPPKDNQQPEAAADPQGGEF